MGYLNHGLLNSIAPKTFLNQHPYPWMTLSGSLTNDGYERLRGSLPDVSMFKKFVDVKRAHGQKSHDRYILHYLPNVSLEEPWKEFIQELQGEAYVSFLRRTMGLAPNQQLILTMEWYYAWEGCSVSPHCDARRKLATHIFYFNTEEEWKDEWGGQILILDDEKRFKPHSGPDFDEFKVAAALHARGNDSLLFMRTDHSWHGVRPLECPSGVLRKLFIITVNIPTLQVWWRRVRGKDPDGYRMVS